MNEILAGRWYWILLRDGEIFPAMFDNDRWSNMDCWEDYNNCVIGYELIALPLICKKNSGVEV